MTDDFSAYKEQMLAEAQQQTNEATEAANEWQESQQQAEELFQRVLAGLDVRRPNAAPAAAEMVVDAYTAYNRSMVDHISRGDLNIELRKLWNALDSVKYVLGDPRVNDGASLLAFGMSPSKKMQAFEEGLSDLLEGLSRVPKPTRGRPPGSNDRAMEILYDSICEACEVAGYPSDSGMSAKVEELVEVLGLQDMPRKRKDAILRRGSVED